MWGISFDGVAVSGVVTEFTKLAHLFHAHGAQVYLDLGYDIKADKQNFFVPYTREQELVPPWVQLDRLEGLREVEGYSAQFVQHWFDGIHADGVSAPIRRRGAAMVDAVVRLLLERWEALGVRWVVVENGTLPENNLMTLALYRAIEAYGTAHGLQKFVIWRDHDLMWSSETSLQRYGAPPYQHVIGPIDSPFIRYVCLTEEDRQHLRAWVPQAYDVTVLPNGFAVGRRDPTDYPWRRLLGLDRSQPLIARTTRIIGPKRLDRDLHLLAQLNLLLPQPAHLAVAGSLSECPTTTAALQAQMEALGLRDSVTFVGHLAPETAPASRHRTVGSLMAEADLVSFMPAYDYDSYGNPVGEAAASGVPFCASRFARFDAVWGSNGLRGPVLEITQQDHELPDGLFVQQVAAVLTQPALRAQLVAHNMACARRLFSVEPMQALVASLVGALVNAPALASKAVAL